MSGIIDNFYQEVGPLIEGDVWDRDFKDYNPTREEFENQVERAVGRGGRLPMRLRIGLFYTEEENEKKLEELRSV